MKKTSLLLAIGALLYGASGSYALADYRTMSDDEIMKVLIDRGCIADPNAPDGVTAVDELNVPPEGEVIQGDVTAAKQNPPPSNIWVNNDNPVNMSQFCGFRPTGFNMAKFPVIVNGGNPVMFGPFTATSGIAIAADWILFEDGDTWNHKWCLVTEIPITDIVIDPLSRTGPGPEKYAFDIIYEPIHSGNIIDGSARGWGITQQASPKVTFKATYTRPVFVPNVPNVPNGNGDPFHSPPPFPPVGNLLAIWNAADNKDDIHDMYGTLKIEFEDPALGLVELPTFFTFRADTDCLPVNQGEVLSYNPDTGDLAMNIIADKDGLAAIMQKCGDDVSMVAGPFDLTGYNDNTVTTSLQLKPDCCYSLRDLDSSRNVPISGIGVITNANNELCPG